MNRSKFKGVKLRKINNRKYLRQLSAVSYNICIYIYVILYVGDCKTGYSQGDKHTEIE